MDEANFSQAIEEWIEHCRNPQVQFSSSSEPVRDCEAYGKIVSMGYTALPLIRQVYNWDGINNLELSMVQGHGLASVVREIVGADFSIPKEIHGLISALNDYTKRWLDENMSRYVPTP